MAKGTKLWMEPRSPLIQGRSRMQRPLWRDWLATSLGASAIAAPLSVWLFDGLSVAEGGGIVAATVVASFVIAGPVVWFIRKLGARNPWRGSAVVTAGLAPLAIFAYTYFSVMTLGK